MSIILVNKNNFESEVMNSDKTVLVDFSATWCGPCKMIAPILEEIANEYPQYKICKTDVDDDPELAMTFGVSSIPMIVVIKNRSIVAQSVGLQSKESILKMLEKYQ